MLFFQPLAGANDDTSTVMMLAGFVLMFAGAFITGTINGFLIRFANFTPIAATLAMYIAMQGVSFLLRDNPDGSISATVTDWVNWQWGPFPVAFLVLVAFAVGGEYLLRCTKAGWRQSAVGSDEYSSRRAGMRIDRTFTTGYIVCSLLTSLGAVMLMTQIGPAIPARASITPCPASPQWC